MIKIIKNSNEELFFSTFFKAHSFLWAEMNKCQQENKFTWNGHPNQRKNLVFFKNDLEMGSDLFLDTVSDSFMIELIEIEEV